MPSPLFEEQHTPKFVIRAFVVFSCALCLLAACSSPKEIPKETEKDSGPLPWSKSDTKAAVDSLTTEMIQYYGAQGLQRWLRNRKDSPTLIIGPIRNGTAQPIDTDLVAKDLKKSISERSARTEDSIQVLWEKDFLCKLRSERTSQTSQCGRSTGPSVVELAVELAKKRGADFVLIGVINSNDSERREDERPESYTLFLSLSNVAAQSGAWDAATKIKRVVYWLESSPRSPKDSVRCRSTTRMSQTRMSQC
jgi:hypothetical protein